MKRYDAILFDAGETLLHPHPSFPELMARFIRERGHRVDAGGIVEAEAALASAISDMLAQQRQWSTSPENSRAFWTGLYRRLLQRLGIEDPDLAGHLYARFAQPEHYALFDDALPALQALHAGGYKLGIVSNFEAWLEGLLSSLEVMPMLDALVISGVEGVEKPDPKIFRLALERVGVPADRACYVGDNPAFDIEPALALGMGALLIDRRGRYDRDRWPVIGSLTEIPEVIA